MTFSPDLIRTYAVRGASLAPDPTWAVEPILGHASSRAYFRVKGGPFRRIVMVSPPGLASEEANKGGPRGEEPFLQVQRRLGSLGIRVPAIHAWDPEGGVMVLEDLGETTFEDALAQGADPVATKERLYCKAIDLLATLRARADRERDPGCVSSARSYDYELFRWELDHYLEWGLGEQGIVLEGEEAALFSETADRIARELDELPKGFTHRDFQSRNLMVLPGEELALIDFQDALQGPHVYDLVALLRDSYVELPMELVERMIARYVQVLEREGGGTLSVDETLAAFHLLTVQRKLKDAGRFVFLDRVKNKPNFLPYVAPSLLAVRAALEKRPDLEAFGALLRRYVPELA